MRQFSWCAVGLYIYSNTLELPRVTDLVIEREVQILNFLYGPSVMVYNTVEKLAWTSYWTWSHVIAYAIKLINGSGGGQLLTVCTCNAVGTTARQRASIDYNLLDSLPWRCLVDTHQQLFLRGRVFLHGLKFLLNVLSCAAQPVVVCRSTFILSHASVSYDINPSFLWSPPTHRLFYTRTAIHNYARKFVATYSDHMTKNFIIVFALRWILCSVSRFQFSRVFFLCFLLIFRRHAITICVLSPLYCSVFCSCTGQSLGLTIESRILLFSWPSLSDLLKSIFYLALGRFVSLDLFLSVSMSIKNKLLQSPRERKYRNLN